MKLMICGFGRVGRAFTELLLQKYLFLQDKYGLDVSVGAVVDFLGCVRFLPHCVSTKGERRERLDQDN